MKINIKGLELLIYCAFMGFMGEVILLRSLFFSYIFLLIWVIPFSIGLFFAFLQKRHISTVFNPYTLNPFYVSSINSFLAIVSFYGLSIYFIAFTNIILFVSFQLFFDYKSKRELDLYTESQEMSERLARLLADHSKQNLKIGTKRNYNGKVAYTGKLLKREGVIIFDEDLYKSLTENQFNCLVMHEYSHFIHIDQTKMTFSFIFIILLYVNTFLFVLNFFSGRTIFC